MKLPKYVRKFKKLKRDAYAKFVGVPNRKPMAAPTERFKTTAFIRWNK